MEPDEVAKSYDRIAERWNARSFPRDNGMEQHQRALTFLKRRRTALDIGCGSSGRLLDLLIDHGFDVEGVDISERMIALAKRRHPNVTFHHADICGWTLPRRYDFITAWDSIWHVPLRAQRAVLTKVLDGLCPGGVCIFSTGGLDGPSERRDAAMGVPMYHSTLGIPGVLEAVHGSRCVCRHLEYDQYPELHLYVIAQKVGE